MDDDYENVEFLFKDRTYDDGRPENELDIRTFCRGLEQAWMLTPRMNFGEVLGNVFRGYNLSEMTSEELEQMLNDYLLQNQ